eukprot:3588588-Rhodomonas_salina.1
MECVVLSGRMAVRVRAVLIGRMVLHTHYALSGTELGYGGISYRFETPPACTPPTPTPVPIPYPTPQTLDPRP